MLQDHQASLEERWVSGLLLLGLQLLVLVLAQSRELFWFCFYLHFSGQLALRLSWASCEGEGLVGGQGWWLRLLWDESAADEGGQTDGGQTGRRGQAEVSAVLEGKEEGQRSNNEGSAAGGWGGGVVTDNCCFYFYSSSLSSPRCYPDSALLRLLSAESAARRPLTSGVHLSPTGNSGGGGGSWHAWAQRCPGE